MSLLSKSTVHTSRIVLLFLCLLTTFHWIFDSVDQYWVIINGTSHLLVMISIVVLCFFGIAACILHMDSAFKIISALLCFPGFIAVFMYGKSYELPTLTKFSIINPYKFYELYPNNEIVVYVNERCQKPASIIMASVLALVSSVFI